MTRNIRLGSGVLSLPYHNPFMVADRLIMLDHLTRGRVMLGVGPGALATDALTIGLDPADARAALETDVDVLMHLLRSDEPISIDTGRYRLSEARLQMDAYSWPHPEIATAAIVSPSGPRLVGKHGLGMISIGATMSKEGFDALGLHWNVVEERAKEFGQQTDRIVLASRRPDAPRGHEGPGDQGRGVRHRRLVRLPAAHRGRPAAGRAGREHARSASTS